ncbi:class II aldolase/adducin family protein [Embleya sp. NBC_00888]|uniref:class II aldolase/adducin family protein n=1 Tax=Embleya sp. NBC_00888 TaxID=2975960 RepID=UPI0038685C4B|nr:class II aldolase/adducin family protein [Embleya sp. NBC_00888]
MRYTTEREHAVRTTEHLKRWDVLEPGGGALSRRLDDGNILMACTGLSFRWWDVTVDDFIVLDPDGDIVEQTGALGASGTPVHLALYREFPACHGIVHAHSPHALAFASLGAEIPSVTNQLDTLGTIACASADDLVVKQRVAREGSRHPIPPGIVQGPGPYAVNMEIVPQILDTLRPRAAELDRHGLGFTIYRHGLMAIGRTLDEAANNAHRIESGARAAILQATLAGGLSQVRTNPLYA